MRNLPRQPLPCVLCGWQMFAFKRTFALIVTANRTVPISVLIRVVSKPARYSVRVSKCVAHPTNKTCKHARCCKQPSTLFQYQQRRCRAARQTASYFMQHPMFSALLQATADAVKTYIVTAGRSTFRKPSRSILPPSSGQAPVTRRYFAPCQSQLGASG